MDSGLYAAYAGLLARTQALDVAANNLANAGTNGFRAGRQTFHAVMAEAAGEQASQVGGVVNNFGVLGDSALSKLQGAMTATGNPLDVALDGQGYFAVATQSGTRYTRDGSFRMSQAGELETGRGEAVLDVAGKHIALPDGPVKIGADGTISSTASDGTSAIVAQLGMFNIGEATAAEGTNLYSAQPGAVASAATATARQGSLESSNQDAVTGTMQLMSVQRQAEMMQRALTVFHNDFDKLAAEELPRI